MAFLANIDGALSPAETAKVPVLDRGFLYGDSVYEVVRTYGGRPFALTAHLERLEGSAARLAIPLPPRRRIAEEIERTLAAAGNDESYCRVIVTRGSGPITLDPTAAVAPLFIVLVKEFVPFPDWMYERGIRVTAASVRRSSPEALDPAVKSGNYLCSVLAMGEARQRGFEDGLFLDGQGRVTEATSSNVFALLDGELVTPRLDAGLLAGVTRRLVLRLAEEAAIPAAERHVTPADLARADEVMLTSTLREVMPVVAVDSTVIGNGRPGPLCGRLRELLRGYARRSIQE